VRDGLAALFTAIGGAFGVVAAAASGAMKLLGALVGPSKRRVAIPTTLLAAIVALLVVAVMLCGISAVAHGLVWNGLAPLGTPQPFPWTALLIVAALVLIFGRTYSFLNRSTLAGLYAARLTRAYLGASNASRRKPVNQSVTRLLKGDEIDFRDYAPNRNGGPLHIFNVTLNETLSGQSQVEERDRHGMIMAIGPAGVSVAARHHALWVEADGQRTNELAPVVKAPAPARFLVFPPSESGFWTEPLDVGQWVAVSGAAVSPGLGWRTSIGLSLITGLLNVRLGRWWGSGVSPALRDRAKRGAAPADHQSTLRKLGRLFAQVLPVQGHLLDELLGRFHGPARRFWYLTDGGHFENTGIYELIRRRVSVIVACDNGTDGAAHFTELADLIRKARTDFNAEITFMDAAERQRALAVLEDPTTRETLLAHLGDLEDLGFGQDGSGEAPTRAARGDCYGALAWVEYDSSNGQPGNRTLLMVIKPRVTAGLPVDVREYKQANPDFPQQSTADQFFDERQWESHRKLGQEIGRALFPSGIGFWPALLTGQSRR
jgi:hypothetical protein